MWKKWIEDYYNDGIYKKEDVKTFVEAGWINETDYKDITGEAYSQ